MGVKLPAASRKLARDALALSRTLPESARAGTRVGLAVASRIARGLPVDGERVFAYLSRAEPAYRNARAQGLTPDKSKAVQAFYLWGGRPALAALRRRRT